MIHALIDSALILERLEASSKHDAIEEILTAAVDAKRLSRNRLTAIRKRIEEREALGSTGIGNGVAVPHVKVDSVQETLMILARSVEGIDYGAIDGRPVHVLFLIVAPKNAADEHLQLLRWISGLARNADFRRFFAHAADAAEIRDLLTEMTVK